MTSDGCLPLLAGILFNGSQLNTPFGSKPDLIGVTLKRDPTANAEMIGKEEILVFDTLSSALEKAMAIHPSLHVVVNDPL